MDTHAREPAVPNPRPAPEPADDGLIEQSRARVRKALEARERATTAASAVAFVATAVCLFFLLPDDGRSAGPALLAGLVLCGAAADRIRFEVGFAHAVPTQLVFVPMLFMSPLRLVPLLAALGFVASSLPEYVRGAWHPGRIGLRIVSAWYAIGPVLVLAAAGSPSPSVARLPIVLAALAAQFLFDFASAATRGRALGISLRPLLRALGPAWFVDLALTPLGLALASASSRDQRYAFLFGLPLMGLLAHFARERKARIDHALELSAAYRGTAFLLGDLVEADDAYTGLHSQDVVSLVVAVCERLGLDADACRDAELTALLHDVGKVKVAKEIINKPGKLTPEERAIVDRHTIYGQEMLERVGGLLGHVGRLVRSCHERWDGCGYPDGLAGDAIPLVSRIVCACDAYSAMTDDRPYRRALPVEAAIEELRRCAGTQFDPAVIETLVAVATESRAPALQAAA